MDNFAWLFDIEGSFRAFMEEQKPWQLLALFVSLGLAWASSTILSRHLEKDGALTKERRARLIGIMFALTGSVSLLLFDHLFNRRHASTLLGMVTALMVALLVARLGVYVLNHVLGWGRRILALQSFFVRVVWLLFALHVTGLLEPLLEVMQDLGINVGSSRISLLEVLQATLAISVTLVSTLWLGNLVERRLMHEEVLDKHVRVIAVKLLRGLLVFLGVVIVLPLVGIDSTFLSVLGGALGVGLGFALQKIASNYVSGFILLLDRSIRLGDVITVEGRQGSVVRMDARSISLSGGDGTVFIVPNETFMTQSIINYSVQASGLCKTFTLELSLENELSLARALMEEALRRQSGVQAVPAATAMLSRYTGYGAEFTLQFWVADPTVNDALIRSEALLAFQEVFRQHDIHLPLRDGVKSVSV